MPPMRSVGSTSATGAPAPGAAQAAATPAPVARKTATSDKGSEQRCADRCRHAELEDLAERLEVVRRPHVGRRLAEGCEDLSAVVAKCAGVRLERVVRERIARPVGDGREREL